MPAIRMIQALMLVRHKSMNHKWAYIEYFLNPTICWNNRILFTLWTKNNGEFSINVIIQCPKQSRI